MLFFKGIKESNDNLHMMEQGQVVWKALKTLDVNGNMPSDPYQEWNR
jgi:hypothetical protein